MFAELRAARAVAIKELRTLSRYPLQAVNAVLQPLYQFLIPSLLLGSTFLVQGRAIGLEKTAGTADVAGFLFSGALVGVLVAAAFWGVAFSFRLEMQAGTLEPVWLTPTRRETFVLGYALSSFLVATVAGLLLLGLGRIVFGAHFLAAALTAAPALLLATVSLVGVAFLISAAVLLIKEPNFFVDSTNYLFVAASGAAFPIAVLPAGLKVFAFVLPTTYALDLLRQGALNARPLLPAAWEYGALVLLAVVTVSLGRWLFLRTERKLRRDGTLGHH